MQPTEPHAARHQHVDGILAVVREGLCHRCGACLGVCPAGTLGFDAESYPTQVADCIRCNACVRACSGLAVDYAALGRRFISPDYRLGSLLGPVAGAYIGHATDPEVRAA